MAKLLLYVFLTEAVFAACTDEINTLETAAKEARCDMGAWFKLKPVLTCSEGSVFDRKPTYVAEPEEVEVRILRDFRGSSDMHPLVAREMWDASIPSSEAWSVYGLHSPITGKSLWETILGIPCRTDRCFAKNPALDNVLEQFVDALPERKGFASFFCCKIEHNDDGYLTPSGGWLWRVVPRAVAEEEELMCGRIRMRACRNTVIEGVPAKAIIGHTDE